MIVLSSENMTFTKKQNDDLCVAAGIAPLGFGPHVYYYIDGRDPISSCAVCHQRYNHEPTSGPPEGWEAWWGICKLTKGAPVYPDLLTAEGFLILWRALRAFGLQVTVSTAEQFGVSAYVRKGFGESVKSYKNKNRFPTVEEALFLSAAKVLGVPGV